MSLFNWLHKGSFAHGIHPPERKELTEDKPIRRLPFAPEMIIPLSQHTGAPAIAIVKEGQEVVRGEPIAKAGGFVSVPMHAPATGKIDRIALAPNARGQMTPAIFLKLYPSASQDILYSQERDVDAMSPEEIIQAVQDTGVVGLGGAAFPTHVKMKVPKGKAIDTIIANGCECEPYLTTDHRVMIEQVEDLITGCHIAMRAVGAERVIIGIEDNKMDAAEAIRAALPHGSKISVATPPTKYPQGAEKMLTKSLLNREIPSGGLPVDVGVAVFNVATLAQLGDLLPKSQGLIERVVTVTGSGVERPGNYLTALGTPLRFMLEAAGITDSSCQIVLGGPMMGPASATLDIAITKGITGILVMTPEELRAPIEKIYPCIKCGACVDACPIHLNPSRLGILARKGQYEIMEQRFHLNDCFECGCCTYVCPSNIPLVQQFRVAKTLNRERKAAAV